MSRYANTMAIRRNTLPTHGAVVGLLALVVCSLKHYFVGERDEQTKAVITRLSLTEARWHWRYALLCHMSRRQLVSVGEDGQCHALRYWLHCWFDVAPCWRDSYVEAKTCYAIVHAQRHITSSRRFYVVTTRVTLMATIPVAAVVCREGWRTGTSVVVGAGFNGDVEYADGYDMTTLISSASQQEMLRAVLAVGVYY